MRKAFKNVSFSYEKKNKNVILLRVKAFKKVSFPHKKMHLKSLIFLREKYLKTSHFLVGKTENSHFLKRKSI